MESLQDWKKVGVRLIAARESLGFIRRSDFVAHLVKSGAAGPGVERILGDLERGSRSNYSFATIGAVESWYQLESGTIRAIVTDHEHLLLLHSSLSQTTSSDDEVSIKRLQTGWDLSGVQGLPKDQLVELVQQLLTEIAQ